MDENGNFPQKSGKTIKTKAKKKKRKEKMKSWRKERKDFGSFGRISQKHLKQQELRRDAEGLQEDMTEDKIKKNLMDLEIRLERF